MNPTVTQQLESMKATMERVVLPALPSDARFAQEQAKMITATLGWLIDVHASELRYELREAEDYRRLLHELAKMPGAQIDPNLLEEPALGADGDLKGIREQGRRLKAEAVHTAITLGGPARLMLLDVADRQSAREQAWFRMTGFTTTDKPGGIAEVLAAG